MQKDARGYHKHPKEYPKPVWAAVFVGLSTIIMTLDNTIVNVALSSIANYFNAPLSSAQWVINAYTLAFASLLLGVGAISDFWADGRSSSLATPSFMLSSLACAFAPTADSLVVFRGTQGFGAAMVFGTCIPLIADAYAKKTPPAATVLLVSP
ncbi:MAG: MFS transporter [Lawsonella clevelandensis]